jgi:WXG100 family type VII secretion target
MSRFQVDAAQIARAGSQVGASATAVRTEVAAMMRHLTDLQGTWQGSAAGAFAGVLTEWSAAQRHVEQVLDQIQGALTAASQHYEEAEAQAGRLFAR